MKLSFKTVILFVCLLFYSIKVYSKTPYNFTNYLPENYHELKNKNLKEEKKVLVGLNVRHGEIIDSLQPIYRRIKSDGSLGSKIAEQPNGGNGGSITRISRKNFVIVGFVYERGQWMGKERMAGLNVVLQKWKKGKPTGDKILVGPFGMPSKISYAKSYNYIPPQGKYVSGLSIQTSDEFVSNINILQFDGKEEVKPLEIKQKNLNSAYNPNDIYYMFDILIVSGTKAGNTLKGIVSFPYNTKDKNFSANRFILHYMQDCYEIDDLDANPTAHINNNNLHNLTFVGGPNHNRFGLNAGFSRSQFMRESEIFVQNGAEYFGYLNPYTYVDGAGIVSYKKLDTNSEAIYKDMVCK